MDRMPIRRTEASGCCDDDADDDEEQQRASRIRGFRGSLRLLIPLMSLVKHVNVVSMIRKTRDWSPMTGLCCLALELLWMGEDQLKLQQLCCSLLSCSLLCVFSSFCLSFREEWLIFWLSLPAVASNPVFVRRHGCTSEDWDEGNDDDPDYRRRRLHRWTSDWLHQDRKREKRWCDPWAVPRSSRTHSAWSPWRKRCRWGRRGAGGWSRRWSPAPGLTCGSRFPGSPAKSCLCCWRLNHWWWASGPSGWSDGIPRPPFPFSS